MKATMRLSSLADYLDISQDAVGRLVATGELPESFYGTYIHS
jgi:hypothetical protein